MDIVLSFILIILAELGDKTQISVILLSSKTKKRLRIFLGAALGFLLSDGAAILFGKFISNIVPAYFVAIAAGLIFLVLGTLMFRVDKNDDENKQTGIQRPFLTAFVMIFLGEMGDKTQIASAALSSKYSPVSVFAGVMAGILLLTGLSVYLGEIIAKFVKPKFLNKIAGDILIALGLISLLSPFLIRI